MLEVKLAQLVASAPALGRLCAEKAPARITFTLARVTKSINSELETYEKTRMSLLEKYGTLSEDKSHYKFESREQSEKFELELKELLETPVSLQHSPLALDQLETVSVSAADLMALDWLIVEDAS